MVCNKLQSLYLLKYMCFFFPIFLPLETRNFIALFTYGRTASRSLVKFREAENHDDLWYNSYGKVHWLRTPNEAFFHWNPKLLGLGRQIRQINRAAKFNSGAFGVFSAELSALDLRARGQEPEKIPQKFRALPAAGVFCQGEDHLSKMKICG